MPHIYEIGTRFYAQFLRLNRDAPLWEKAPTQESEEPHRTGQGVIVRLWPTTHAVVVGRWTGRFEDPAEAELAAMRLVMEPRRTETPYWCSDCGKSREWCFCDPAEDPGFCPACDRSYDACACLDKINDKYPTWKRIS